jgi:hypothetical protein
MTLAMLAAVGLACTAGCELIPFDETLIPDGGEGGMPDVAQDVTRDVESTETGRDALADAPLTDSSPTPDAAADSATDAPRDAETTDVEEASADSSKGDAE